MDWAANRIHFVRGKTGLTFEPPIYSWLRPVLERRLAAAGSKARGNICRLQEAERALHGATERLDLAHMTLRNLRSMRIVRRLEMGVNPKQVALWQGHHDGGFLIITTYSDAIRSNQKDYEAEQLARAEGQAEKKVLPFVKAG